MEILLRLILAAAIFAGLWLALRIVNQRQLVRNGKRNPGLEGLHAGKLGLLYFTTPDCIPCKLVQRPALEQLKGVMGEALQIIEVNAAERTDLADEWGVLSIPTTVLIDRQGEAKKINLGVIRFEQLVEQFQKI